MAGSLTFSLGNIGSKASLVTGAGGDWVSIDNVIRALNDVSSARIRAVKIP